VVVDDGEVVDYVNRGSVGGAQLMEATTRELEGEQFLPFEEEAEDVQEDVVGEGKDGPK